MNLGENLRKCRKSINLSQSKLSKITGIPQTTISDWENEKSYPNLYQLKLLCDALDISIQYLLDKIENKN